MEVYCFAMYPEHFGQCETLTDTNGTIVSKVSVTSNKDDIIIFSIVVNGDHNDAIGAAINKLAKLIKEAQEQNFAIMYPKFCVPL